MSIYTEVQAALLKMKAMRNPDVAKLFPEIVSELPAEKEERDVEFLRLANLVIDNSYSKDRK